MKFLQPIQSIVATGTSPLSVESLTLVSNLNSDLLDGQHGSYYLSWSNTTDKPTTLSGYGILDAAPINSPTLTGTTTMSIGKATSAFIVPVGLDKYGT